VLGTPDLAVKSREIFLQKCGLEKTRKEVTSGRDGAPFNYLKRMDDVRS